MLVDSHCHLDMLDLEQESIADIVDDARQAGVERMLCVSVSSMAMRSMPMPIPPAGGMPCSNAVMKSSSITRIVSSSSPLIWPERFSSCIAGSFSSV